MNMTSNQSAPRREPIEVIIEGFEYRGVYCINRDTITVIYADLSKTERLAGLASYPETLARSLLAELVRESREA